MPTRLYYQISTRRWLHRVDYNISEKMEDAPLSCSVAFGIPAADVAVLETNQFSETQRGALMRAVDWDSIPPALPQPAGTVTGRRIEPLPQLATVHQRQLDIDAVAAILPLAAQSAFRRLFGG